MRRSLTLFVAVATTLAIATTAATQPARDRSTSRGSLDGVKVLISYDDSMQAAHPSGSDGRGLYEMRRALCAAGADVVVVAPWGPQSGAGTGSSPQGTTLAVSKR